MISAVIPREEYAALERCVYLNQASLGLVPRRSTEAMVEFLVALTVLLPAACSSSAPVVDRVVVQPLGGQREQVGQRRHRHARRSPAVHPRRSAPAAGRLGPRPAPQLIDTTATPGCSRAIA